MSSVADAYIYYCLLISPLFPPFRNDLFPSGTTSDDNRDGLCGQYHHSNSVQTQTPSQISKICRAQKWYGNISEPGWTQSRCPLQYFSACCRGLRKSEPTKIADCNCSLITWSDRTFDCRCEEFVQWFCVLRIERTDLRLALPHC